MLLMLLYTVAVSLDLGAVILVSLVRFEKQ